VGDVRTVLEEECRRVSALLLALSEEEFRRPTRCEPWDAKELTAHLYRSLMRIPTSLDDDAPAVADTDSVTYWRSYDVPTDAPVIAAHARATAAEYETGAELAAAFDELWRTALDRARSADPGRLVHVWWGPNLRLDDFLTTRVLEVVVHGLDMTQALRRAPIASDEGIRMVKETLDGLLGHPAPMHWSDIELIEKGTGRLPLSDADVEELGSVADAFPLLG
jgi:uncharacterized protein (TIGR03083 family)